VGAGDLPVKLLAKGLQVYIDRIHVLK
jgi:hypothetical protein